VLSQSVFCFVLECICLEKVRNENFQHISSGNSILHSLNTFVANYFYFSFADRLNASAEHITRYISRDHKIVAGTTYDAVWHLVKRLSNCGLFSTIGTASQIRQNNNGDDSSVLCILMCILMSDFQSSDNDRIVCFLDYEESAVDLC
jgi:hypothetical protein